MKIYLTSKYKTFELLLLSKANTLQSIHSIHSISESMMAIIFKRKQNCCNCGNSRNYIVVPLLLVASSLLLATSRNEPQSYKNSLSAFKTKVNLKQFKRPLRLTVDNLYGDRRCASSCSTIAG